MTHSNVQAPGAAPCRQRRQFLKVMAGVAGSLGAIGAPAGSALAAALPPVRRLSVLSLHTGESLRATFFRNGRYDPVALDDINHLLRDWRTGEVHEIDRQLLDLLCALHQRANGSTPFELFSGYRSPATNARLAANSNGVARRSLHMRGMAADIRLPGCDLTTLHQAAVSLKGGGVGLYTRSDFIHVDTGQVRYWGS